MQTTHRRSWLKLLSFILILGATAPASRAQAPVSYEQAWKRVDILQDSLGQPRSALALVQDLYARARREHDQPQAIRAILYTIRIDRPLEENADSANLHLLEMSVDSFPDPARSILLSLTAQAYWNYSIAHANRVLTDVVGGPGPDWNTWTREDFIHHADSLFSASIRDTQLLGRTAISDYDATLEKGNTQGVRPTLLDLLANRAIHFYNTGGGAFIFPSPSRICADPVLLSPARVFMVHSFTVTDGSNLGWKALMLYQLLLRFHAADPTADAFIDADLNRLQFARQICALDSVDMYYERALRDLVKTYAQQESGAAPSYRLADFLQERGGNYTPDSPDSSTRWLLKEALTLCDQVAGMFPHSSGGINARNLAFLIREPLLEVTTAHVSLPAQPILTSVGYKNCGMLHLRLLKADAATAEAIKTGNHAALTGMRPLRAWTQPLPDPGDYQPHRTEIPVAALPSGSYVLLAATNASWGKDTLPVQTLPFKVSDIGWIGTGTDSWYILHRGSGEPMPGALVHIWNTRGGLVQDYVADRNGHIKLSKNAPGYMNLKMRVTYGGDSLSTEDEQDRLYYPPAGPNTTHRPRFFYYTDRAVYRPGQTVYVKVIGAVRDTAQDKYVPYRPGKSLTFYLEGQGQKLDSLQSEPDEFGSIHGQFVLPSRVRTGAFEIRNQETPDQAYFLVEEYKRPRYQVTIQQPTRDYTIGDTLDLKGLAMAYAGNPIGGARVSYRVSRETSYMEHWDRPWMPIQPSFMKFLYSDSTRTREDGSFSIRLSLIPGLEGRRELDPTMEFIVTADVTDQNGETHSCRFTLRSAYTSLRLTLSLPISGRINADSLHALAIESANLSGAPQRTLTTVTISRLTPPERLIHTRTWAKPDLFALPEDTFHRLFPHEPYGQEGDRSLWPVMQRALRDTFTTGSRPGLLVEGKRLHSGVYRVTVSATDPQGHSITTGGFVEIYNPSDAQLPYPTYEWSIAANNPSGDSVTYLAGSSAEPRFVIQQLSTSGHIHINYLHLPGKGSIRKVNIPAIGEGLGAFAYIIDNHTYISNIPVTPREAGKTLSIQYTTFRDKLEPGSLERLSLSIHGPGHEAADAEVLASMYDASLNQFGLHTWSPPDLSQNGGHYPTWHFFGFDDIPSRNLISSYRYQPPSLLPIYDDLPDAAGRPNGGTLVTLRGRGIPGPMLATANLGFNADHQPSLQPLPLASFRKDFDETAFFYPDLKTDSAGNLSFAFTMPEALTRWTLRTLAQTRDLAFGFDQRDVVTQKTLMLQPNIPRFLREGDEAWLSTRVVNMAAGPLQGKVRLELLDALDMQPVDRAFGNQESLLPFSLAAGSSTALRFHLSVPVGFTHPLVYRLSASAGNYNDGEQGPIPVLNRRVLVTDTYPMALSAKETTHLQIEPLLHATPGSSYRLTLEYCASPIWYVARALPYLEATTDASPQSISDRYYTNTLGAGILHVVPGIKALLGSLHGDSSSLKMDSELKNALLQETPWVMDAGREDAALQHLATFLDSDRLARAQEDALQTLSARQYPSGAFPWFDQGPENRYVTEYILTQLGRLSDLRMIPDRDLPLWRTLIIKAIDYLDARLRQDYQSAKDMTPAVPSPEILQYLYTRTLFKDQTPEAGTREALDYYMTQAKTQWIHANLYGQALIALAFHRAGNGSVPQAILASLEQRSILSGDRGRYWKENDGGWSWSEAPIQTQALLITAFMEAGSNAVVGNQLRTWLLSQKQTQSWSSSPATADACYALLLGANWMTVPPALTARLGDVRVDSHPRPDDAGSLFFKQQWEGADIQPSMGRIEAILTGKVSTVKGGNSNWGVVYYQHFEDLDSIQPAQTTLSVQKQLFVVSGLSSEMRPLHAGDTVRVGDRVRIRLILRSDRPLEFAYLKDLRAACLEPVDVHSGYRRQGGLGYYFSPGDLSTGFYMDWLPKGVSVLEYDQYVNMEGTFSGGMATLQSFYAPQFNSRSNGTPITAAP
jgi:hypothetical protein